MWDSHDGNLPFTLRRYAATMRRRLSTSFPARQGSSAAKLLAAAAGIGLVAGVGSVAVTEDGQAIAASAGRAFAALNRQPRVRDPQPGDYWPSCRKAKAAGTAPIYKGEPGYRIGLDRDRDGIACEPYRGW